MNPAILALLTRSLRVESRAVWTYLSRVGLAAVVLIYLISAHADAVRSGAPGLKFFEAVMYINLVFLTLAGMSYFATPISEEKEELTLGLLRMTRLSPLALLLGKSGARVLGVALLLLAQAPFTALAVTLGGIGLNQIAAGYATLVGYVIFLGGMALLCSVVASKSSGAAGMVAVALLGFYAGPPLGAAMLGAAVERGWVSAGGFLPGAVKAAFSLAQNASPFLEIDRIMITGFSRFPAGYQALSNAAAGIACFLLAWRGFEFFTRDNRTAGPSRGLLSRGVRRRFFSPGRAWDDALRWKDFCFMTGGRTVMIAKFILYPLLAPGLWYWGKLTNWRPAPDDFCAALAVFMGLFLLVEIIVYAGRVFSEEVRWQTLPSLAALPLTLSQVARRKVAGCLMGVIPAAAYFLLAFGLWLLLRPGRSYPHDSDMWLAFAHIGAEGLFMVYLVAYMSLRSKSVGTVAAIGTWIAAHVAFWFCMLVMFELWRMNGRWLERFANHGGFLVILFLICAFLHWRTGALLARRAAE